MWLSTASSILHILFVIPAHETFHWICNKKTVGFHGWEVTDICSKRNGETTKFLSNCQKLAMIQLIMTIAIILPLCITFQLRSHTLHRVLSSRDISTLLGVQDQGSRMVREGPSVMPSAMRFQMRNEVGNKYRELMGENIDELLQLLQQFIDASNYSGFVQDVKTLASSAPPDNPPEMIDSLYQMIKTILDRLKGEQLADIIWSLGKFANRVSNVKFRAVHQRLWSRLCAQINLTSRQVTTSFGGLAKLGILWQGMPPADRTSLERIVVSVAGSLNEREVGNLLHSLSRMGVQWAELSAHVQEALLANLLRQHKSMRAEHGTMTVYALGILGLSVEQLSPAERTGIFSMSTALLQDVLTKPPLRNRCQQVRDDN